jgi:hypothetical protein
LRILSCCLAAVVLLALSVPASAALAETQNCTRAQIALYGCPTSAGSIRGDDVELTAGQTRPGATHGSGGTHGPSGSNGGSNIPVLATPAKPQGSIAPRDGYTVTPLAHPITLADLVNFRPQAGIDRMEPNGWMVVGLDTNFYASVTTQEQAGLLLELPASVRFTPKGYHWTYGDGHSANLTSKGASWAATGVAEFDATDTSHIYRNPGTYVIDLTIDFGAEYQFAGGAWTAIPGTLAVAANRLVASAGDAKTVLVDRDCTASPSGPGC